MKQRKSIGKSESIYNGVLKIYIQIRDKNGCKEGKIAQKYKIWDCCGF